MRKWILLLATATSLSACGMMDSGQMNQEEGITSGTSGTSDPQFPSGAPSEAPEDGPVTSTKPYTGHNPEHNGVTSGTSGTSDPQFPSGAPSEAPEDGPVTAPKEGHITP